MQNNQSHFKSYIRDIPNFPIEGVMFRDVSPLLAAPKIFDEVLENLAQQLPMDKIDLIAGIEARGFILGAALASKYKKGFLPIRKAGKLPPPTVRGSYALEYGNAEIEVPPGKGRVIILDDVLATGGTLKASAKLLQEAGYQVEGMGVLIDLRFLNKMTFNGQTIPSVVTYE